MGLTPLGCLYNGVVNWRLSKINPLKVSVPVVCVGNITMGGTGKTPTVIYLAQELRKYGYNPHVLTRGYGGHLSHAVKVDIKHHTPHEVGDEPMLIAQHVPVWRGSDRIQLADHAINDGATLLIMDDGLQNPSLYKDCSIGVFDAQSKIGNGRVFPAGPLRQSLRTGLSRTDLVLMLNGEDSSFEKMLIKEKKLPIYHGKFVTELCPDPKKKYLAFAGLGIPDKFFNFLREKDFNLSKQISYPDHHNYTSEDLSQLKLMSVSESLQLITTEKDAIKFPREFLKEVDIVSITLHVQSDQSFLDFLLNKLK